MRACLRGQAAGVGTQRAGVMKKLINAVDGAVTDALAGMAAAPPSLDVDMGWLNLTRSWDAPVSTPAHRWER
jgi:hypothetical protein